MPERSSTLHFFRILLFLLVLLVSGCAPYQPRVEVESDPAFSAGRFGSWNFVSPLAIEEAGFPDEVVEQFKRSVESALGAQGFERVKEPQLLVNVAAVLSGEGSAALNSDAYQAIHPQRGTFHDSWRGYGEGYGASTRQQRFGDGSINIGIISSDSLELVWEGIATGRLSGDRSKEEMMTMIDAVSGQILSELPRGDS